MAKVLVTIKATPQPSEKYGDTVCVAGIRVDGGRAEWIRLYPIAFRWLSENAQFNKYDVIEVEIRRRDQDTRKESYSPNVDSIRNIDRLSDWDERLPILQRLPETTTCDLSRAAAADDAAPSLGIVPVVGVPDLEFEPHPPWNPEQRRKLSQRLAAAELDLFGSGAVPGALVAPRLKVRYRYFWLLRAAPAMSVASSTGS